MPVKSGGFADVTDGCNGLSDHRVNWWKYSHCTVQLGLFLNMARIHFATDLVYGATFLSFPAAPTVCSSKLGAPSTVGNTLTMLSTSYNPTSKNPPHPPSCPAWWFHFTGDMIKRNREREPDEREQKSDVPLRPLKITFLQHFKHFMLKLHR